MRRREFPTCPAGAESVTGLICRARQRQHNTGNRLLGLDTRPARQTMRELRATKHRKRLEDLSDGANSGERIAVSGPVPGRRDSISPQGTRQVPRTLFPLTLRRP